LDQPIEITPENLVVKLAESPEERKRIYQFRYEVYIEEMGKNVEHDEKNKILKDDLDESGRVYYMEANGEIISTIRVNLFREGGFNDFIYQNCGIERLKKLNHCLSYTSKLMVTPRWRQSVVLGKLLNYIYSQARELGIKIDFCYCAPSLVAYYELLGYRRYKDNFIDPGVGYRIPMALLIEDVEYMRKTGSPFYRIARNLNNTQYEVDYFRKTFASDQYFVSSKVRNADYFWERFADHLHNQSLDLFKSMDRKQVDSFINRCTVISCKAGDSIIRTGDVGKEMFVILSGAAEVRKDINDKQVIVATFGKGQVFGEMAFLSNIKRTAEVVAINDLETLVLTQELFHTLLKQMPENCAQILLNLSSILCDRLRLSTELYLNTLGNQDET